MKKNNFTVAVLITTIILTAAFIGNAQTCPPLTAGCLDYTFGNSGTTLTYVPGVNNNFSLTKGTIQSDGKMLGLFDTHSNPGMVPTNVVIRYNQDGSLDTAFGSGGILYMNWNTPTNSFGNAYAIAVQQVGTEEKILVAGTGYGGSSSLRVDRYNPDGSLDSSFDLDGSSFINAGYALAMAVQPDGKILTMGDVGALVRLNVNGSLDTTFGSGGVVQSSAVSASALAVQSNGRILAAGRSGTGKAVLTVVRFNSNGTFDDGGRKDSTPGDSFGTSGTASIEFYSGGGSGTNTHNNVLKIDSNGKILVACEAWKKNTSNNDFALARLTANGQFDTTFDLDGKATVDLSGVGDSTRGVALQSDGKIVLTGIANTSSPSTSHNLGMVRFNSNGTLDTTFGQSGIVIGNSYAEGEWNYSGMIQFGSVCSCEKIAVIGTVKSGGIYNALASRYLQ